MTLKKKNILGGAKNHRQYYGHSGISCLILFYFFISFKKKQKNPELMGCRFIRYTYLLSSFTGRNTTMVFKWICSGCCGTQNVTECRMVWGWRANVTGLGRFWTPRGRQEDPGERRMKLEILEMARHGKGLFFVQARLELAKHIYFIFFESLH